MPVEPYDSYVARTTPTPEDLAYLEERLVGIPRPPKISILLALSDPDEVWIKASASSVLDGVYPHVELCVCDDASVRPHVAEALEGLTASDERVKVVRSPERSGLRAAHDAALSLATGKFVAVLGEGDAFAPGGLFRLAEFLRETGADVAYADEDSVDISDRRSAPIFKPHWSPELLLSTMYAGRPCAVRRELAVEAGGFGEGMEGSGEHDLLLRTSERTGRILHLPGVLYHRRVFEEGASREDAGAREASRRAVGEALERRGEEATVETGTTPGSLRVKRGLPHRPTVSVVALVGDESLVENAHALGREAGLPAREVIPVDAGGSAARAANEAAGEATGDFLLFLRNYRESAFPGLLAALAREAQRAGVGAVGGRVFGHNGDTRGGGSFVGVDRLTGSPSRLPAAEELPPLLPVIDHPFDPLAVSGECMMIRRSLFEEAGGFDGEKLPNDFYDLDLSFRLLERGFANVYVPEAGVIVGDAALPAPGVAEIEYLWNRWWSVLVRTLHYRDSPLRATPGVLDGEPLPALFA